MWETLENFDEFGNQLYDDDVMNVLVVNVNDWCFENEGVSIEETIVSMGLKLVGTQRGKEIVVYLDEEGTTAILLHYPLCVAGDSRRLKDGPQLRAKRGFTVAVLCNVVRYLQRRDLLSKEDDFENPIHAMLAFQIVSQGFHMPLKVAAAFYREFVTPLDVEALWENNLAKRMYAVSSKVYAWEKAMEEAYALEHRIE